MLNHICKQTKKELMDWLREGDNINELKSDIIDPLINYLQGIIIPYIAVFAFLQLATLVTVIILILKPANISQ